MASIKVPYLKLRDGRHRWEPSPELRERGFKGRDLKDDSGQWLGMEAAIASARLLNDEVNAWRANGQPRRKPPAPVRNARSCQALYEQWIKSPGFTRLAISSQRDYHNKAKVFLAAFGEAPVVVVSAKNIYGFWQQMYEERGHAMANGVIAVVRAMFSYALPKRLDWRPENPALALGLDGVPPRVVVWTNDEIAHLVAIADTNGAASIADAIIIALHTGQRQGDVLALEYAKTEHGKTFFKQSKRNAIVSVPQTPQLADRIAAIRARRTAGVVALLDRAGPLVRGDLHGREYTSTDFRHRFAEIRTLAAVDMPTVADKWFSDLRDTAITRLAQAGCSNAQISSITGHAMDTINQVLKHYIAFDRINNGPAIELLIAHLAKEGAAI
jgi:integrase